MLVRRGLGEATNAARRAELEPNATRMTKLHAKNEAAKKAKAALGISIQHTTVLGVGLGTDRNESQGRGQSRVLEWRGPWSCRRTVAR